jgi:uncharacterized protein YutE (UPF0331/DUF86 family)
MDQRTVEVIRKKLAYLEQTLAEITPYLRLRYEDYVERPAYRRATERLVQILVEIAGDTSELLLRAAGRPTPGSMREALRDVRELGAIDDALFERFNRSYIGLRNRIVHDYETLDNRILFRSARRLRKDSEAFLRAIVRYLTSARPERKKSNARRGASG